MQLVNYELVFKKGLMDISCVTAAVRGTGNEIAMIYTHKQKIRLNMGDTLLPNSDMVP